MYRKVTSKLTGDLLSWIKARLDDKTEIRLKTRLLDLIEKFSIPIDDEVLEKIIATRNHFVHLDKDIVNVLGKDELYNINQVLEENIIRILLREISIDQQ